MGSHRLLGDVALVIKLDIQLFSALHRRGFPDAILTELQTGDIFVASFFNTAFGLIFGEAVG
ncbi:hypothetical protein AB664_31280 [Brucella anthropi]|uniref:Uncharacterized protein n=1 Tax=Brucella anthropi TaxID=529 RepID=A0A656Z6G7_BRUAN|nr:hypothetical protein AB664_31280 [Brucella anthropi]